MSDVLIAHSANRCGDVQPLLSHLQNVGNLAARFAEAFGGQDEARIAGRIHDLGKSLYAVQSYLKDERESGRDTHHAPYGAAFAYGRGWPCAFAIAGHHAGLHDLYRLKELVEDDGPYAIAAHLPKLEEIYKELFGTIPESMSVPRFVEEEEDPYALELYIRMIFSCLVDADYLDTDSHYSGGPRASLRMSDVCDELLARLCQERDSKPSDGIVNRARHSVFDACLAAGNRQQGFFSLTVPTGGGKTLSGMAFALSHANMWDLERVIVVIPYLSIIEQNADEYRRILDPENLGLIVEHHSAVPDAQGGAASESSAMQRAAENWDAPIIITTSVQFIESLFASSASKCRKLHNLARSVVLIDEVQALPAHLLNPLLNVLKELHEHYGVSFLFMTATQPAFRHHFGSLPEGFHPGEVTEIVEDRGHLFHVLKRVEFRIEKTLNWDEVADRMAQARQVLCVVNIRAQAFDLWNALHLLVPGDEEDSVFHLSSSMCAEHRLRTIGKIKDPAEGSIRNRLRHGLPCRLVSTQVVEAGVDVDFPLVFRAMGPLDSVVQTAGRCNREGRLVDADGRPHKGQVVVFKPPEHRLPPGLYKVATELAEQILHEVPVDSLGEDPGIFAEYFAHLFQLTDTDHSRPGDSSIQEDRRNLRYRQVSAKAKVIPEGGVPVVVPFGPGSEVVEELRVRARFQGAAGPGYGDLRRLQRFMVNVRERDFQKLHQCGMIDYIFPQTNLFIADARCYDDRLGLVIKEMPVEDLIL